MKRSPLIIVATLVILGGFAAVYLFNQKAGLSGSSVVVHIPRGQETTYKIAYNVKQKPQGQPEVDLFHIEGRFANYIANEGELVSEWQAVDTFNMVAKPVEPNFVASMLNKPLVTRKVNGELEHFIGKDFPGRFLGLQLGLLDKIYSIENNYKSGTDKRHEHDELGSYDVQYSFAQDKGDVVVTRQWLQSTDGKNVIDANHNTFKYTFDGQGKLLAVRGDLILNNKSDRGAINVFSYELTMDAEGTAATATDKLAVKAKDYPKADLARAEVAGMMATSNGDGSDERLPPIETFQEALVRADKFGKDSSANEQQEIFQTIKFGLMAHPEELPKVVDKLGAWKATDDDVEARSSLLFGAITASGLPEVADSLTDLAQTKCQDDFCKVQAMTSLNIHDHPSEANGQAMINIAHSSKDDEIASVAYLAAGSVASKVSGNSPDIEKTLLTDFNSQSTTEDRKLALIKAMGNHGSTAYYDVLSKEAKSEDTIAKSSALYSLRNVSTPESTDTIIAALDPEGSDVVNTNGLRALGQKTLSTDQAMKLVNSFANASDKTVQSALTDVLINAYRAKAGGSEEALNALKEKTTDPDLKTYVETAVTEVNEDRLKEANYEMK